MELGVNFINAVKVLADERNLSEEEIFASVEEALALTYKKFRSTKQQPVVKIDRRNGDVIICDVCKVTDEEEPGENEVTKARAAELGYPNAVAGDSVEVPVLEQPEKFGRVAAQTARQQIVQKLKDAERKIVYNEFNDKKGDLVSATIFKMEDDQVIVRLPDHNEAVLPREERISGEEYKQGETMKFFLLDVRQSGRGAKIFVSRTHPSLLRKLLEVEIPEIHDGTVKIENTAREAGSRAKVAVSTEDPNVDPVGACVGSSGTRIRNISSELNGEKIDIIIWRSDPLEYIKNALSPAKVISVEEVPGQEKTAKVYAPADQLSLAIGKAGQNVRLAARLTGWKIDINAVENAESASDMAKAEAEV